MTAPDTPYPRPSFRDWALLTINIVFVVCGAIPLRYSRDVGILNEPSARAELARRLLPQGGGTDLRSSRRQSG